jgi:hypothetical protein
MGWCDKDRIMLHAVFQLLVDFVEQEKPDQIVDYDKNRYAEYDASLKKHWLLLTSAL